MDTYHL